MVTAGLATNLPKHRERYPNTVNLHLNQILESIARYCQLINDSED